MVVDDNPAILEMVSSFLAVISDARISAYSSGTEALAAFSAEPEGFQLVITDWEMPRMDGLELTRQLRARNPGVKVVLITGNHAGIEKASADENGLSGFLYKPFGLDSLQQLLEELGVIAPLKPVSVCADQG
jgi:CheY-like chemotaxis protein